MQCKMQILIRTKSIFKKFLTFYKRFSLYLHCFHYLQFQHCILYLRSFGSNLYWATCISYYHKKYSICIGFLTTNVFFEIQHVSQGWSLIWNWALYAFFGRFSRTWWWDRRRAAGLRTKYYFIAAPGSTSKLEYFSSLPNEDRSKLRCDSKRKRLRRRRFDDVFCKVVGYISMTTTNYHLW